MSDPRNLVHGEWVPARGGGSRRPSPHRSPARGERGGAEPAWPRSGAADVRHLLARRAGVSGVSSGAGGPAPFGAGLGRGAAAPERGDLPPAELRALLERARNAVLADPDPDGTVARGLGLTPAELRAHLAGPPDPPRHGVLLSGADGGGGDPTAEGPKAEGPGDPDPRLLLDHPAESPRTTLERVLAALATGTRELLWIAGPASPAWACRVAVALLDAGLPPERLQLLHDDGQDTARAARDLGGWPAWDVARPPAVGGGPGDADALLDGLAGARVRTLRTAVLRVHDGAPPEAAAEEAARLALGRAATGSGRWAGQVGRIRVPARSLSAFTAALLARLEDPGWEPRAGGDDPALRRRLEHLRALGLGEGATLVLEGRPRSSPGGGGPDILGGLLFTNVEPHMRVAAPGGPLPAILLERVLDSRADDATAPLAASAAGEGPTTPPRSPT